MPYIVPIAEAKRRFPKFSFVKALTPSEQKAAFHVRNSGGKDLCLKIISPSCNPERVEREILAMKAISSPFVVQLQEYHPPSKAEPEHYTVENFIAGVDLADKLSGAWPTKDLTAFFSKLFEGLNALQLAGVVHRDLKPNNIRVSPTGDPVIVDFGLVRHLSLPDVTKTAEGAAIGTPAYFAPEQFLGTKADIDSRTDFFAAGILMYQAAVGKHPFDPTGRDYEQLKKLICFDESHKLFPAFLSLDPKLRLAIERLLQKQRVGRPLQAKQFADLLAKMGAKK